MINEQYQQALKLVKSGALVKRTGYDPHLEVFCYTQETFWDSEWNDITLSHRGKIYYKGLPVNYPFPKIFNLNEHESTKEDVIFEKMKTSPYEVLHKSNGHLMIASVFEADGEVKVVYSTKGSLPNDGNDLLNKDIEILKEQGYDTKIRDIYNRFQMRFTFMFEAIVEHDKHTLYDQDVARYGGKKNNFVLLGVYSEKNHPRSASHDALTILANEYDFDLVECFDEMDGDVHSWFDHKDTEGYVIHFTDDSDLRVKIKTKDYWLMRSRKDLRPENIVGMFRAAGFDRLHKNLPEEVAVQMCEIVHEVFTEWVVYEWGWLSESTEARYLDYSGSPKQGMEIKDFMSDEELSQGEREMLLIIFKGGRLDEYVLRCSQSREKRKLFHEYFINSEDEIRVFAKEVEKIFEQYGEKT